MSFMRASAAASPARYADRVEVTPQQFDQLNQERINQQQLADAASKVTGAIIDNLGGGSRVAAPPPAITPMQIGIVVAVVGAVAWLVLKK